MSEISFVLQGNKLPESVAEVVQRWKQSSGDASAQHRMRLVIELSRLSVDSGGGPFGAAVFANDGVLLSVGINRVVPWNSFEHHAECVALALAQQCNTSHFQLSAGSELVTSSAPCCMCFGKFFWSGSTRLTVAARRGDVESIVGFDEGPIPENWQHELRRRGFDVTEDVLRDEAIVVLKSYRGPLYQSATHTDEPRRS